MTFSRQEYRSRLPLSGPGDLPDPGIETLSPSFPEFGGNAKKTIGIAFLHSHNSTEGRFQNGHFTDEETGFERE